MPATEIQTYVGRFAPSPTGPLHFGSLLAAVASYLDARHANGRWLLRIEDIDPPREQAGADIEIIEALDRYGFEWDGPVTYQSSFRERHREAVERLLRSGWAYPCTCSRRDLAQAARGPLGRIYPGTCRSGTRQSDDVAVRVRTTDEAICFTDRLQGAQSQRLESQSGDFVILRRDGLIAYQLAVAVDDAEQGVTDVVRGLDLLPSTARQIHLQRLLGLPTQTYAHVPLVENTDGSKLSKGTGATPIPLDRAPTTLLATLAALRQRPPKSLSGAPLPAIWDWAVEHWDARALAGQRNIALQHYC